MAGHHGPQLIRRYRRYHRPIVRIRGFWCDVPIVSEEIGFQSQKIRSTQMHHFGSGTTHAACEDYRAAADTDLEMDEADDKAGHKIVYPVHALWGAQGTAGQRWRVVDTWKPKASEWQEGSALPGGHLLPEEQPDEVLSEFQGFFAQIGDQITKGLKRKPRRNSYEQHTKRDRQPRGR